MDNDSHKILRADVIVLRDCLTKIAFKVVSARVSHPNVFEGSAIFSHIIKERENESKIKFQDWLS